MYSAYKKNVMANNVFVSVEQFGVTQDGKPVKVFKVRDATSGYEARFIELGAAVQALYVPDSRGLFEDVVLGFDTVEQYELHNKAFQGVVIGRVAGRIRGGKFDLNGVSYDVTKNDHEKHHLHGGFRGIYKSLWSGRVLTNGPYPSVQFECVSPHMDEGFPGEAKFRVTYSLLPAADSRLKCTLRMQFEAQVDRPTPISPDTHVLFNLNGERSAALAPITNHLFQINSDRIAHQRDDFIPTGYFDDVGGANAFAFDFRKLRHAHLVQCDSFGGYAHAYENSCANKVHASQKHEHEVLEVASAFVPQNGRKLVVRTDAPTTVFYTGFGLDGTPGKHGQVYRKYSGFLFICEHSPNAVNLQAYSGFTDPVLLPGRRFERLIDYEFSVDAAPHSA